MLAPATGRLDELPTEHPCFGCEVRAAAVCGVLGCTDLAAYRRLGWTMRVRAGQALFHEGDPVTRVFTLTEGAVKLYRLLPDGRRQVVGFLAPGDFLGISVNNDHSFSTEALADSRLCWLPRNRFGSFTEAHPDMERELYRIAAHELGAAQAQMVLLGRKTAEERVASFFLLLVERAERASGRNQSVVALPMSRLDIADYLGLTKETVSRVLAVLRNKRAIRLVTLDRIELLDRAGLTAIAEGAALN